MLYHIDKQSIFVGSDVVPCHVDAPNVGHGAGLVKALARRGQLPCGRRPAQGDAASSCAARR
ncbi:MAG TPA: hypothetical protein PLV07_11545, partial [Acidiphilium sp.]|nr:hypothetical protein [Acidiphilium sp.]